jgi:catechol 2,3-dioxygenase-like lactoylglutathione lyase family enzyme
VPETGVGFAGFTEALSHAVPFVRVRELARSLEFYVDHLGFREVGRYCPEPDLPGRVVIARGGVTLTLTERDEAAFGGLVSLHTSELETVFHELAARGVTIDLAPTDMPWSLREMHLRDPDGNHLHFVQSILV